MEERKKILVVEDEQSMAELLRKRLEKVYSVTTACDGQEGLNKARAERPDLILADVMMPRLDGYHMCRVLKFDEKYRDIPIIVLTSRQRELDRDIAKEVGADDYITKPFKGQELMDSIKRLLG